jgi:hypothetical protein
MIASWLVVRPAITSNAHYLLPGKDYLVGLEPMSKEGPTVLTLTAQEPLPWNSRCIIHDGTMSDATHVNTSGRIGEALA